MPAKKKKAVEAAKTSASTSNPSIFRRIWTVIKTAFTNLLNGIKKIFGRWSNKSSQGYKPGEVVQTVHRQLPPIPGAPLKQASSQPSTPQPPPSVETNTLQGNTTPPVEPNKNKMEEPVIQTDAPDVSVFRDDSLPHPELSFRDDSNPSPSVTKKSEVPVPPVKPAPSKPIAAPLPPKAENPKPAVSSQATAEEVATFKKQLKEFMDSEEIKNMIPWIEANKASFAVPGMFIKDIEAILEKFRAHINEYSKIVCRIDEKQLPFVLPRALQKNFISRSKQIIEDFKGLTDEYNKPNARQCCASILFFDRDLDKDIGVMQALEAKQLMDKTEGKSIADLEAVVQVILNESSAYAIRYVLPRPDTEANLNTRPKSTS